MIENDLITRSLYLARFDAGVRKKVLAILNNMQQELVAKIANKNLTALGKRDVNRLIKQNLEIITEYYGQIQPEFAGLVESEVAATSKILNAHFAEQLAVSIPTANQMAAIASNALFEGHAIKNWWAEQEADYKFRFAGHVRQGMAAGETNQAIIARVTGGMADTAKRHAATLVQTSVAQIANDAKMAVYERNEDISNGYRFLATLDSRTSKTCMAYSGATWDINKQPTKGNTLPFRQPPLHFNCRSTMVMEPKTFKELGIDLPEPPKGTRASSRGQVPADTTFEQYLKLQGKDFTDEMLGPGRAELWRKGKITLRQLIDGQGRELTLAQLNKKYN